MDNYFYGMSRRSKKHQIKPTFKKLKYKYMIKLFAKLAFTYYNFIKIDHSEIQDQDKDMQDLPLSQESLLHLGLKTQQTTSPLSPLFSGFATFSLRGIEIIIFRMLSSR